MEIYSSETGSWRASGEPFTIENDNNSMQFHAGVYWNGAINWFSTWGASLYFNVDEERLGTMPMLPVPEGNWYEREFRHYGESRGHLHLVEIYGPVTRFNVYEMERDYSGWFVKYRVDLDGVGIAFPEMMERRSGDEENYSFTILSLVRLEKDESFLVLHTPGKVIHYSLGDGSFRKICDVAPKYFDNQGVIGVSLRYFWFHSYD
ncbi:F-box protein At5g07610-like [Actinidia eriantha]|uniref:F-box protein At5g07610-like n=1 Tax=Actinidia eriantha TaxID=165200 RepID=UPI00258BE1F1|nr:F-box protein At5g07610-like [Actinidia eriantha]